VIVKSANRSEEGWLDEGLSNTPRNLPAGSYLAQADTAMFSKYAIGSIYDGYQYLLATRHYPADDPRRHGNVGDGRGRAGSSPRYIVDQFGAALPGKLVQTSLTGPSNVRDANRPAVRPDDQQLGPRELGVRSARIRGAERAPVHDLGTSAARSARSTVRTPRTSRWFTRWSDILGGDAVNLTGALKSGSGAYSGRSSRRGSGVHAPLQRERNDRRFADGHSALDCAADS